MRRGRSFEPGPASSLFDLPNVSSTRAEPSSDFAMKPHRYSDVSNVRLGQRRVSVPLAARGCAVEHLVCLVRYMGIVDQVTRVDAPEMTVAAQVSRFERRDGGLATDQDQCHMVGETQATFPPDLASAINGGSEWPSNAIVTLGQYRRAKPLLTCTLRLERLIKRGSPLPALVVSGAKPAGTARLYAPANGARTLQHVGPPRGSARARGISVPPGSSSLSVEV